MNMPVVDKNNFVFATAQKQAAIKSDGTVVIYLIRCGKMSKKCKNKKNKKSACIG